MKTRMKKLISIGTIPVLALALLVVLGTVLETGSAPAAVSGSLYAAQAGDTETDGTAKKFQGTISMYLTEVKVDVEADIAAIEDAMNQYALALNTGDLELWLSLHTDDIVKMGPGAPAIFGIEDLRAHNESGFDNFTFEMTIYPEETQVSGDLGYNWCTYTVSMTPKAGGETIIAEPDGKALGIYKRQADGSWKLSHDCYNSNVPPPQ